MEIWIENSSLIFILQFMYKFHIKYKLRELYTYIYVFFAASWLSDSIHF